MKSPLVQIGPDGIARIVDEPPSRRERIATAVLGFVYCNTHRHAKHDAATAVKLADALIAELDKETP